MTHVADTHRRRLALISVAMVSGALVVGASAGHAAGTPEQQCQKGRYTAAAKYTQCELRALGKGDFISGFYFDDLQRPLSRCRVKYIATWAKLQAKAIGTGSACDNPRYRDNGDGTVTDNLTRLVWEQKGSLDDIQNLADPHDADNRYTWSTSFYGDADGTIFKGAMSFLLTLNSGGCFAGQCDWRIPTRAELQTILSEPYPCTASPCIDPIFGPTAALYHYSSTTPPNSTRVAWEVLFANGDTEVGNKTIAGHVRAVRGGL